VLLNTVIEIIYADITTLEVNAIVNAANKYLMAGGGVCGAIHKAAGRDLEKETLTLDGCKVGEAKITAGYNLPAEYVIHTVGPQWFGGERNEAEQLASCYKETMRLANENGLTSIAFPAISTGVYGYPIEGACTIAIREVSKALGGETLVKKVVFSCVQPEVHDCLTMLVKEEQYICSGR